MALDHASKATVTQVWAMIVVANALIYAVLALVFIGLFKLKSDNP
jgi:hypothetical protein